MRGGWVYIMTNRRDGTLYTGVISNLARRAHEHRTGALPGFTKIKHLTRAKKVRLIQTANPDWKDLYGDLH
jgi:putative endonuclease